MGKSLQKIAKEIIGKSITIQSNRGGHGYVIGSSVNITHATVSTNGMIRVNNIWSLYPDEFSYGPRTKAEIKKDIASLQKEITALEANLEFMEETGLEEYDETEVKVYQTLKLLKQDNLSDVDKTKLIAGLIKG